MKKLPEFIIVADSETSGLDFEKDRIVTFFIGKMNQAGEWVEKHEWLLNPEMEIPEQASAVHGVSTEKAIAEGSDFAQGVIEIAGKLFDAPDYPLVFQNAPYDLTILDRNLRQIGVTNGIDNLINKEWKTNLTVKPDSDGKISFRGFRGTYKISWKDKSVQVFPCDHAGSTECIRNLFKLGNHSNQ